MTLDRWINSVKLSWKSVASCVTQVSGLDPILFFINGLGNGVECTLSKFIDDTKLGILADSTKDHIAIQRDLNRMEWWADRNLVQFNKKYRVLQLGSSSQMLENSSAKTGLRVPVDARSAGTKLPGEAVRCPSWEL